MSEQRFCSYCGQRITTDAEQRFCQSCGKPLYGGVAQMPYFVPPKVEFGNTAFREPQPTAMPSFSAYKPKWWQNLAAVLFIIVVIGEFVLIRFFPELYWYIPDFLDYDVGLGRFVPLLMAVCVAFLLKGVKNSATLTAIIVWIVIDIIYAFLSFTQVSTASLGADVYWALYFVLGAVLVYVYSLIDQNNKMSISCRTWLNVLAIVQIAVCSIIFIDFAEQVFWNPSIEVRDTMPYIDLFYLHVRTLLFACGFWVLARSEVFGGSYNYRESCNFSPLNRKMAMTIISPVVFFLLVFLSFEYVYELIIKWLIS